MGRAHCHGFFLREDIDMIEIRALSYIQFTIQVCIGLSAAVHISYLLSIRSFTALDEKEVRTVQGMGYHRQAPVDNGLPDTSLQKANPSQTDQGRLSIHQVLNRHCPTC